MTLLTFSSKPTDDWRRFNLAWNNGEELPYDGKFRKFRKDLKWQSLERLGDAYIRTITQLEFSKIFGPKNYFLNNLLVDHANSNLFFEAVTIHYKLETRVKLLPRNWMGNKDKLRADIFEAWIGGHIYERMQYDDEDPLYELRYFLNRLWSIRYSRLKQYRHNPISNLAHIPSHSIQSPIISTIISHSDSELKRTSSRILGRSQ